ncbi:MAG: homocysteine S-methyltransferase [Actinomycetes bacterium]
MFNRAMLLDGGLSTALEQLGNNLNTSLWSGELLRTAPDQIEAAHKAFVDAGAQIIITSSYQISMDGCSLRGWNESEVRDALLLSTELARNATRGSDVKVAASVGPYGASLADGSEYRGNYGRTKSQLKDFHRMRLQVLVESNPDLLAIETIPELTEAEAILELLEEQDMKIPYWMSFSCKDGEHISSGELFRDAVNLVSGKLGAIGVGINCTAPEFVTPLLSSAKSRIPFVVYPNSGRTWNAQIKEWEGAPTSGFSEMQIFEWKERGAKLIGGCCSVGPAEIAQMRVY